MKARKLVRRYFLLEPGRSITLVLLSLGLIAVLRPKNPGAFLRSIFEGLE